MVDLMHMVQEGAPFTFGLICCGLMSWPLGLAAAAIAFINQKRSLAIGLGVACVLMAASALMAGGLGWFVGNSRVDDALMFADPEHRALIEEVGRSEARIPLWFGLGTASVPGLLGLLAVGRGATLKSE